MRQTTPQRGSEQGSGARLDGPISRASRAVLTVVVVAALCYLAYGFGRLWAEWRHSAQPVESGPIKASKLSSLPAVLPLAGPWTFADLDWNLRANVLPLAEVAARLETLATLPVPDSVDSLPDVSQELIDLAAALKVVPAERGANHVYTLDQSDLKARLVVRKFAGGPKVLALAAAFPQSESEWQFVELTPRGSTGMSAATESHLLPLPASARQRGGRFSDDGRLLLELVALDSDAEELLSLWQTSGWEVQPSGLGAADDFSYLCARGGEVIYAWSANSRDALKNLMLVRSGDSADTNAQ